MDKLAGYTSSSGSHCEVHTKQSPALGNVSGLTEALWVSWTIAEGHAVVKPLPLVLWLLLVALLSPVDGSIN